MSQIAPVLHRRLHVNQAKTSPPPPCQQGCQDFDPSLSFCSSDWEKAPYCEGENPPNTRYVRAWHDNSPQGGRNPEKPRNPAFLFEDLRVEIPLDFQPQ